MLSAMDAAAPIHCLVKIEGEPTVSMYQFVAVPLVGDRVDLPHAESLLVCVVSSVTHFPQPAGTDRSVPLCIVTLEKATVPNADRT